MWVRKGKDVQRRGSAAPPVWACHLLFPVIVDQLQHLVTRDHSEDDSEWIDRTRALKQHHTLTECGL